jgi:hypothetical protein
MRRKALCYLYTFILLLSSGITADAQSWIWAKTGVVATNQNSFAHAVVADTHGNSYVTGSFYAPTIQFDTSTLNNIAPNGFDVFVVKYRPNGSVAWARSFGGAGNDEGDAIALDAQGHIYIAGSFDSPVFPMGTATFTNAGGEDLFFAKLDTLGHVIWARAAGGSGNDVCNAICTDAKGRPCIAGDFNSSFLPMGFITLADTTSQTQPVVAKYDTSGTLLWAQTAPGFGGSNGNYAGSICSDSASNLYVTGGFSFATIRFGTYSVNNNGVTNVFLAKYDTSGTVSWIRTAGGRNEDAGSATGCDRAGNVYMGGSFNSPAIGFGSDTLYSAGQGDAFLVKYDPNGVLQWTRSAGGNGDEQANGLAVDAMGHAYLCGSFGSSSFHLGTSTLVNNGNLNIFLAEYDTFGAILWARCTGGTASDYALSAYTDLSGNAWMAGYFTSPSLTFDSHTLIFSGASNMYVSKLSGITGIQELTETEEQLTVYPNPSDGHFQFRSTTLLPAPALFTIYNAQAQVVRQYRVNLSNIDVYAEGLAPGLYLYTLQQDQQHGVYRGKLIIR